MLRFALAYWRPTAFAAVLLTLAAWPADLRAAGHAGNHGGFSSGFHGGYQSGYHAGYYGGYRGSSLYHPGYYSGYRLNSGYRPWYGYGRRIYGAGYYNYPGAYNYSYLSGGYDPSLEYYSPAYYYSPNAVTSAPDYGFQTGAPGLSTSSYATPATAVTQSDPSSGPAAVNVRVPADAQVWFDDSPTQQTGERRQYQSPPLATGKDYTYDVRARWTDGGRVVDETRHITVQANGVTTIDFTQPAPAVSAAK
jgi:uncharacterized protein (TIGR03000 family)